MNKKVLILKESELIELISEMSQICLTEQEVEVSYEGCPKLTYIQRGSGNLVADADKIQQFLKIEVDWDFGNDTADAVASYLGYPPGIRTRADLVNYMYPMYPKEFGTPADLETFGLGPKAQGKIGDLLQERCKFLKDKRAAKDILPKQQTKVDKPTEAENWLYIEYLSKIMEDSNYEGTEKEIEAFKKVTARMEQDKQEMSIDSFDMPGFGGDMRQVGRYWVSLDELKVIKDHYGEPPYASEILNKRCVSAMLACDSETGVTEHMIHLYRRMGTRIDWNFPTWDDVVDTMEDAGDWFYATFIDCEGWVDCLQNGLDGIAIVAAFIPGPGWVVSAVAGLASAGISFGKEDYGQGAAMVIFELFPITRIGKRIFKYGPKAVKSADVDKIMTKMMDNGFNTKTYKTLKGTDKEIADYVLKNVDGIEADVMKAVKNLKNNKANKNLMRLTPAELKGVAWKTGTDYQNLKMTVELMKKPS